MNIFDTFIGVLLAFIVKDFYDLFIQSHIKNILIRYKTMIKSNDSLDKQIFKLVKEGKLKLMHTKLVSLNDNDKKIKEVKKNVSRTNKTKNA